MVPSNVLCSIFTKTTGCRTLIGTTITSLQHQRIGNSHIPKFVVLASCYHSDSTHSFNICKMRFQALQKLYSQWQGKRRQFKKIPPEGLTVEIDYADTQKNGGSMIAGGGKEAPTVLILHGSPGNYQEYDTLIPLLKEKGARVIAPNYPTLDLAYKTGAYRPSGIEKAELIKEFLSRLNVPKIDMLISHSSSLYATLHLLYDNDGPDIKSLVFLAPSGHRRITVMKPFKSVVSPVCQLYLNNLIRPFLDRFVLFVMDCIRSPLNRDLSQVMIAAITMAYADYKMTTERMKRLGKDNIPILMIMSEADKLIDKKISYEMADILGAKKEDIFYHDREGTLCKKGTIDDRLKVVSFKKGSHYIFLKHGPEVNQEVVQFFDKVWQPSEDSVSEKMDREQLVDQILNRASVRLH